jgi:murein DD-endopeptidase MepM/ murein hydrolase activator NlpD
MRLHTTITDTLGRIPRTRNAVIATGVGASLALGSGVALAAGGDIFAADNADKLSHATEQQAGAQSEAAAEKKAEAEKQAQAEKKAEARAGSAKEKSKGGEKSKDGQKKASRSHGRGKSPSWVLPVSHPYTKTAGFADSGDRWSAKHSGQDFAVPTGTSVQAVHNGTVVTTGWGGSYGNRIVVEHANGKYSQYAHLSSIGVAPGEQVNTGEQLGQSGSTGNSSGPHLHFEVRTTPAYGSGFDPVPFLKNHGLKP